MGRMLVAFLAGLLPSTRTVDWVWILKGQSATVSTETQNNYSLQGGDLTILPGARIGSVSTSGSDRSMGTVTMSGGQVDAGMAIVTGTIRVSGGSTTGYDSPTNGGAGLYLWNSASILAGTFTGGNGGVLGGTGVVASAPNWNGTPIPSTLQIGGGTFIGGAGAGFLGGNTGYSLFSAGDTTVTGGHFLSPIAIDSTYGGVTDFIGSHLSYSPSSSTLSGTLANGDLIDVHVYLSGSYASVSPDGSEVRFTHSIESYPPSGSSTPTAPPTDSNPTNPSDPVPTPAPIPDPAPVPEPGTLSLFAFMALAGWGWRRCRRDIEDRSFG